MDIPVGAVLRSIFSTGWIRRVLDAVKGVRITGPNGTTIVLSEGNTPAAPGRSKFDSKPHQPAPPAVGGPRR